MRSIFKIALFGVGIAAALGFSGGVNAATTTYFQTDTAACVGSCTMTLAPAVPNTETERDISSITCTEYGPTFADVVGSVGTTFSPGVVYYRLVPDEVLFSEVNGNGYAALGPSQIPLRVPAGAEVQIIFTVDGGATVDLTCTLYGQDVTP
jgi:hypothetical protein